MPEHVFNFGSGSSAGFVERAFASCSSKQDVALQYAGRCTCALRKDEEDAVFCPRHMSTLLEISTGALDGAAWLGWISQFPDEDEYCLAAGSLFQTTGVRRERHVNIYQVSVRDNICGPTLEQLKEQRKHTVLEFGAGLLTEAHQLLISTPAAAEHALCSELARLQCLRVSFVHKYSAYRVEWCDSVANYQWKSILESAVLTEWKSILESSVLSILSWLQAQESSETMWSASSKHDVFKMHQMALLIMLRCADAESGANNIRVLRGRLAQFVLKYGADLEIATAEIARYWWEFAVEVETSLFAAEAQLTPGSHELLQMRQRAFPEALSAFQKTLNLRSQLDAAQGGADVCKTMCKIANLYRVVGDIDKANATLEDARAGSQILKSRYHLVMADVAHGRALLYCSQDQMCEVCVCV